MNNWETIRLRCVRDKEPIKRVARELGCAPNTIRKYVRSQAPPRPISIDRVAILDKYQMQIDELLRATPKITAKRIIDVLRRDYDDTLAVGERAARKYIATRRTRLVPKEVFIRAEYLPGQHSQFDFSPMRAVIAGKSIVLEVFVMRLNYSTLFYARTSEREDLPALMSGINGAIQFFGGVPYTAVFDNAKTCVNRIGRGRERIENSAFQAYRGELALDVQYAAPARGNEKGGVEGAHGFIEDNFFRPIPEADSIEQLNERLVEFCLEQRNRIHSTHREKIGDRFEREQPKLRPLPNTLPDACTTSFAKINKFAEVVVKNNRYSVPGKYALRDAFVDIWDDHISIRVGSTVIATHRRLAGRRLASIDPLHYLDALSQKHRASITAAALTSDTIPAVLLHLRDLLLHRYGDTATKQWMQVLCLAKDTSLDEVASAVSVALGRGTLDFEAIALLLRQRPDSARRLSLTISSGALKAQCINLEQYAMNILTECSA